MKKLLLSLACVLTLGAVSAYAADPIFESFGNNGTSNNTTANWDKILPKDYNSSASESTHKSVATGISYTVINVMYTQQSNKYFLQLKKDAGTISFTIPANCESITLTNGQGGAASPKAKITIGNGTTEDFTFSSTNKFTYTLPENYTPGSTMKIATNGGALRIAALTYNIKEAAELTDFTALPSEISLMVGDETPLTTEDLPSTIQFTPSSDFVAVSETGVVTGIHEGTGEIEATWEADSKYNAGNATISVTVTPKQKTIYTGFPPEKTLTEGDSYALADINTPKNIIYSTDNKNVVSVSDDGVLTARIPGTATISIMWDEDEDYLAGDAEITVTVTEKKRLTYELPEALELTVGDTKALLGENHPTDIFFLSDDENIVTVSDEGVVTAIAAGTTTIAAAWDKDATYKAGNAIISVTVKEAPAGVTYQLVKSVSELNTTDTYIFVSYGKVSSNYMIASKTVGSAVAIDGLTDATQPEKIVLAADQEYSEHQLVDYGTYKAIYNTTLKKYIGGTTTNNLTNRDELPELTNTDASIYQVMFSDVEGNEGQIKIYTQKCSSTTREFQFQGTFFRNYTKNNGYKGVAIYKKVAQATEPEELTFEHTIFNHNYGIVFSAGQNAGTRHNDEAITDDFTYEIRHNYPEEDNLTVYVKLDVHAAPAGDDPSIDQPDIMAKEGFTAYEAGSKITVPTKSIGTLEYYAEKADAEGNVTHRSPVYTLNFTDDTSAVDAIEIDSNATVEYFNLQGVKVAQPAAGLYIVKRGNTVTKEIVK